MKLEEMGQSFHLGYLPALDGIRGFAVLWVIAFHFGLPLGRDGLFGVDIFFTLSGFLITVLLLEEWNRSENIHLKYFYIRRILRLFPALIVMLIVLYPIAPHSYIFSTLFYSTNWVKALHLLPDSLYLDHTWSLSIEEQYYLLWPIILLILLRIKIPKNRIFLIPLMLGLASAVVRIVVWNSTHDWFRVYMGTDLHADGLLLGSAFGLLTVNYEFPDFSMRKQVLSLITLITLLMASWLLIEKHLDQSIIPIFGNLGVAIGSLVIIGRLVNYPSALLTKFFSFYPLVKIGVISYGLYLWHAPIAVIIDKLNLSCSPFLQTGSKIFITFLVASLSYLLIEKPVMKYKIKFLSKKT